MIDTTNHLLFVGLALETAQSLASETNHHWHMKNINLSSEKWNNTRTYLEHTVVGCETRKKNTKRMVESQTKQLLVGGWEHEFHDFPYIGNVIIPTDELIFFRGVGLNHQPDGPSTVLLGLEPMEVNFSIFDHGYESKPGNLDPDGTPNKLVHGCLFMFLFMFIPMVIIGFEAGWWFGTMEF